MDIKLLDHQYEVLADTKTKIIGMISGFGGGKTYTMCRKAIQLSILNKGFTGIATEPTHDMLRNIFIPEMIIALAEWGIKYKLNKATSTFLLDLDGIETKIICMSMENYERLVGVNAAWAVMDEVDTSKGEIAENAYNKILGRIRTGNVRQLCIFSTPEGFSFCYKCFVTDIDKGSKRLVKAKTSDNKHLPADFIETLKKQYPEQLLKAYLNGEFVNLTQGSVFSSYDREKHNTNKEWCLNDSIIIGQDFNIGGCCSVVYVLDGHKAYAVDEFVSNNTYEIISNTLNRFKGIPTHRITFFPDASGFAGKTNASRSDIQMIVDAGFRVNAPKKNGRVVDRIVSTNNKFEKMELFVNSNKCPRFANALEQQAYKENGEPEKFNGAETVDDWNDAGTYPIVRLFPLVKPKIEPISMSYA